jgi:hypothetical protein
MILTHLLYIERIVYDPKSDNNVIGSRILMDLIQRISKEMDSLDWVDVRGIFYYAGSDAFDGIPAYIQKHTDDLSEYKDIYIIDLDNIGDPLRIYSHKQNQAENSDTETLSQQLKHHLLRMQIKFQETSKLNELMTRPIRKLLNKFHYIHLGDYRMQNKFSFLDLTKIIKDITPNYILELLYNVMLSLDKRIGEKIAMGE